VKAASAKAFILLNKTDLLSADECNKKVNDVNSFVTSLDIQCETLCISAKKEPALEELREKLLSAEKSLIPNAETTFVTNVRHFEALQNASSALAACLQALSLGIPSDLVAEDLRRALSSINAILGTDLLDPESILHNIFSKHCIGK
jgi:tRNA modification GTPase